MDFFGILFDMKNGKKVPYSKNYFDTLLADNLAGVTTLTGTLPLTFTTSETALRSWTIFGADIEHVETASGKSITFHTDEDKLRSWAIYGNDNVGKNLCDFSTVDIPAYAVIKIMDDKTGTISFDKTGTNRYAGISFQNFPFEDGKTYIISYINKAVNTSEGRVTLRRMNTNGVVFSDATTLLSTTGQKSAVFTYDSAQAPSGVYVNISTNWNNTNEDSVDISNFMIREAENLCGSFRQGSSNNLSVSNRVTVQNLILRNNAPLTITAPNIGEKRWMVFGVSQAGYTEWQANGTVSSANVTSDSGWKTRGYTVDDINAVAYGITVSMVNASDLTPSDVDNLIIAVYNSTTESYAPYQVGVGQRTKNLVENIEQGSWSATGFNKGDSTTRCRVGNIIDVIGGQQYTMYLECPSHNGRLNVQFKSNDGTSKGETGWQNVGESGSYTAAIPSDATKITIILTIDTGTGNCTPSNFTNVMLVEGSTAPQTFIPYGYEIPLNVNNTTQDIYIGDSPLTAGQSVSKTSTGVDIATADGNNTITTSLYNAPDMSITYNKFTGVGIHTANRFMIALQLKAGGQTLNVFNILMNKPLRAGETLTSEQTGQTINTVAGVENKLSPAPEAASYGGSFNMTIKYKE